MKCGSVRCPTTCLHAKPLQFPMPLSSSFSGGALTALTQAGITLRSEVNVMDTSIGTRQNDFAEMDNAGISKEHWKIMLISGMGFFTDAYDLFIIGVVMALLKPMWHVGKVEESLVESTALLAAAIGALLFGRIADMGLTRFCGHLSVYREGVSNGEQRNEVSSGVSQANGRIGLGGPQIWGPVQGVWSNGLDDPKMGQASRARC